MTGAILGRLDHASRALTPTLSAVFLVLVGAVPWHVPEIGWVMPSLALMAVYFWSIHRPDFFPASAVFGVGLLHDALSGAPIGLNALLFLIAYGVAGSQRVLFNGKSFLVVWWGFMMLAVGVGALEWIAMLIAHRAPVSPWPAIFAYFMSVALYPPVAALLVALQRTLPRAAEAP